METHRLVLPGDLNHYGSLFGGRLLSWVDEAAWIAASAEFPHCQFVTIGMDRVEFRHGVADGTILRIACTRTSKGRTSVTYEVIVAVVRIAPENAIFRTNVTFVSVDDQGAKTAI